MTFFFLLADSIAHINPAAPAPITITSKKLFKTILNTPVVQQYFQATYSSRSFSINFNIKMPLYDSGNKYHQKIMELAREATNYTVTDELLNELEFNYLDICKEQL